MGALKKIEMLAVLICVLALAMPILKTPPVFAQDSPEVNQLLVFFRDVLLIDTSQCSVSGGAFAAPGYDNSPELGTRGVSEGKVTLTFNTGGSVDSLFEFRGKYLVWCLIYYDTNGSNPIPYIKAPSSNPLEAAKDFLQRYEEFTKDSRITEMSQLLSTINTIGQTSKINGNLKMDITVREGKPDFSWSYSFEGEDYRLLSISFFSPPHIFTFGDSRYKYNTDSSVIPKYEPLNTSIKPDNSISPLLSGYRLQDDKTLSINSQNINLGAVSFAGFCFAASVIVTAIGFSVWVQSGRRCNFNIPCPSLKRGLAKQLRQNMPAKKRLLPLAFTFILLFSFMAGLTSVRLAQANFMYPPLERIYIQSDGTISPSNGLIVRAGNVYTLIGKIVNNPIEVQCNNIILDGGGFSLIKNTPAYGRQEAVSLIDRNNVTIKNLNISGYDQGIYLSQSHNCEITQNTFSVNKYGIILSDRSTGNHILDNSWSKGGISIYNSANNIFRNNILNGDGPNLWVDSENVTSTSDFLNDLDESNTINGKTIYYWINQQNRVVPSNAGYVALINCSGITVTNLNLSNNGEGVLLISTKNTQVLNNNLTSNNKGIAIYDSPNNYFAGNNLINNTYAIICCSRPNTFTNNHLQNNTYDANFEDRFFDEFDRSNIVDGKPICYWLWQQDKTVPFDSGYVVLLSCKNITVQNLNITNRRQAMLLMELTDSIITRNIITNNQASILLKGSSNNRITQNLIANNTDGIYVEGANSNEISLNRISFNVNFGIHLDDDDDNNITYNYISHGKIGFTMNRGGGNIFSGNTVIYTQNKGLHIGESVNNIISGNNIAWSKGFALTISGDKGSNSIHHNNFVNNAGSDAHQGYPGANTPNQWDDGYEGNFWSDYQNKYPTGTQIPQTGLWDTAVTMNPNNIDRFPLTKPVIMKYQVTILQPSSTSFNTSTVPLSFFVTGPVSRIEYSLDGNSNVTSDGDILLTNLDEGIHSITVFAANEDGECSVETTYFGIGQNTIMPSPTTFITPTPDVPTTPQSSTSPTQISPSPSNHSISPSPTEGAENKLPFSSAVIWLTITTVIILSISLASLYFIRRRKNNPHHNKYT